MSRSVKAVVAAVFVGSMLLGAPGLGVASPAPGGVGVGAAYAYFERDRLVLVDADGQRKVLAAPDDLGRRTELAFAPDGRRLAYIAEGNAVEDVPGVFLIDPFVEDRGRRVASGTAQLDWSPDGRHLAYQAPDGALMTLEVATGREVPVAAGSEPDDPDAGEPGVDRFHGCPDWSPDGSMLAVRYQSFSEGGDGPEGARDEIRVYRGDGSGLVGAVSGMSCPTWAPDGSRYAYVSAGGEVRSVRPDGSGEELVVAVSCGGAWRPQWGPTGVLFNRSVQHSQTSGPATELLRPECAEDRWNGTWLRTNDGTVRRVLTHDECCAVLTPAGDRFTYPAAGPRANDYGSHNRQMWVADLHGNAAKLTLDHEWTSSGLSVAPAPALDDDEVSADASAPAPGAGEDDAGDEVIDERFTGPPRQGSAPALTTDTETGEELPLVSADERALDQTGIDGPPRHENDVGEGHRNERTGDLVAAAIVAAAAVGAILVGHRVWFGRRPAS